MDEKPKAQVDVSKVYLLQEQLENLVTEVAQDEAEIKDPTLKLQLQASREMVQKLVDRLKTQIQKENPDAVPVMPPGFKQRR